VAVEGRVQGAIKSLEKEEKHGETGRVIGVPN